MTAATSSLDPPAAASQGKERSRGLRRLREGAIFAGLLTCGLFTVVVTATILYILVSETIRFFEPGLVDAGGNRVDVDLLDFLLGFEWNPLLGAQRHFGIWPLIAGTLQITVVAMCVAIPIGLITAIWLSEYASAKVRKSVKPILEVLAGIPTVVFGVFAVTMVTPLLQLDFQALWSGSPSSSAWNPLGIGAYNVLAAGLTVGIMCIPIISSLSEDALRAVPRALREGAYGLGSTRFETATKVVLPAGLSGVIAAILLAIARAVGETMIVALAAGSVPVPLHTVLAPSIPTTVAQAGQIANNPGAPALAEAGLLRNGAAGTQAGHIQLNAGAYVVQGLFDPATRAAVLESYDRRIERVKAEIAAAGESPVGGDGIGEGESGLRDRLSALRRDRSRQSRLSTFDRVSVWLAEALPPGAVRLTVLGPDSEVIAETVNGYHAQARAGPRDVGGDRRPNTDDARLELIRLDGESGPFTLRLEATRPAGQNARIAAFDTSGLAYRPVWERIKTPINVTRPTQPMTGYMVQIFMGDVSQNTVEYQSVYAVGFTLFTLTLLITLAGGVIRRRFRQAYE